MLPTYQKQQYYNKILIVGPLELSYQNVLISAWIVLHRFASALFYENAIIGKIYCLTITIKRLWTHILCVWIWYSIGKGKVAIHSLFYNGRPTYLWNKWKYIGILLVLQTKTLLISLFTIKENPCTCSFERQFFILIIYSFCKKKSNYS